MKQQSVSDNIENFGLNYNDNNVYLDNSLNSNNLLFTSVANTATSYKASDLK